MCTTFPLQRRAACLIYGTVCTPCECTVGHYASSSRHTIHKTLPTAERMHRVRQSEATEMGSRKASTTGEKLDVLEAIGGEPMKPYDGCHFMQGSMYTQVLQTVGPFTISPVSPAQYSCKSAKMVGCNGNCMLRRAMQSQSTHQRHCLSMEAFRFFSTLHFRSMSMTCTAS
jgi:hypothetical protein